MVGVRENVERYLMAACQAGLSAATIKQYGWHLERLAAWLQVQGVERVSAVTRDHLWEWGAGLRDAWGLATVKQAISAARAFFRWCCDEGLAENVGAALKLPRVPVRVQRTITAAEVRCLLGACDLETIKGCRDAALVVLLIDTGLRALEVCRLQLGDLRLDSLCLLATVKGGDQAVVHFGDVTARRLREWLEVRPGVAIAEERSVFVSCGGNTPGRSLTTRGLRCALRRLGDACGLDGVTTHAFRRGFAIVGLEAGASMRAVQAAGRWNNLNMVVRYSLAWRGSALYERHSPADFIEKNDSFGV